jgi:hypothetical protein
MQMNVHFAIYSELPAIEPKDALVRVGFIDEPHTIGLVADRVHAPTHEDGRAFMVPQSGEHGERTIVVVFASRSKLTQQSVCRGLANALDLGELFGAPRVLVHMGDVLTDQMPPILVSSILHCCACQLQMRHQLDNVHEIILVTPAGMLSAVGYGLQSHTPLCVRCSLSD